MLTSHILTYTTPTTRTVGAFPLDKGTLCAIGAIVVGGVRVEAIANVAIMYACPEGGALDLAIPLCAGSTSLYNGPSWFGRLPLQPAGQITMQMWAAAACQLRVSLIIE